MNPVWPAVIGAREPVHVPPLVELEAEPVRVPRERCVLVVEQGVDRVLAEDAGVAVGPAVDDGLGEYGEVVGRGEDTGVPGDPVERPRVLVVHAAADHAARRRGLVLRRGDPVELGRRRVVAGVAHPQRPGDAVVDHLVQRLAGDELDQLAGRDHVQVGVEVRAARRVDQLGVVHGLDPRLGRRLAAPQRQPGREARGVGEQLAHGHGLLAVGGERRDVRRDGAVQVDPCPPRPAARGRWR